MRPRGSLGRLDPQSPSGGGWPAVAEGRVLDAAPQVDCDVREGGGQAFGGHRIGREAQQVTAAQAGEPGEAAQCGITVPQRGDGDDRGERVPEPHDVAGVCQFGGSGGAGREREGHSRVQVAGGAACCEFCAALAEHEEGMEEELAGDDRDGLAPQGDATAGERDAQHHGERHREHDGER